MSDLYAFYSHKGISYCSPSPCSFCPTLAISFCYSPFPGQEDEPAEPIPKNSCPEGANAFGSYCYFHYQFSETWTDADVRVWEWQCGEGRVNKLWELLLFSIFSGFTKQSLITYLNLPPLICLIILCLLGIITGDQWEHYPEYLFSHFDKCPG